MAEHRKDFFERVLDWSLPRLEFNGI